MKLLFAITLVLVLSQAQESSEEHHESDEGSNSGPGPDCSGPECEGGRSSCDAASDVCEDEFRAMMECTSDACAADNEWMSGSEGSDVIKFC